MIIYKENIENKKALVGYLKRLGIIEKLKKMCKADKKAHKEYLKNNN